MNKYYVTHLECSMTGKIYPANEIQGLSEVGRPLLVRYDLEKVKKEISREEISNSKIDGLWRYSPLLPVKNPKDRISLGEVITPLIKLKNSVSYTKLMKFMGYQKQAGLY
jgi:threonine synthase